VPQAASACPAAPWATPARPDLPLLQAAQLGQRPAQPTLRPVGRQRPCEQQACGPWISPASTSPAAARIPDVEACLLSWETNLGIALLRPVLGRSQSGHRTPEVMPVARPVPGARPPAVQEGSSSPGRGPAPPGLPGLPQLRHNPALQPDPADAWASAGAGASRRPRLHPGGPADSSRCSPGPFQQKRSAVLCRRHALSGSLSQYSRCTRMWRDAGLIRLHHGSQPACNRAAGKAQVWEPSATASSSDQ